VVRKKRMHTHLDGEETLEEGPLERSGRWDEEIVMSGGG
jgi:hypothetical protein